MATCIICEEPAYITGAGGFATCRPHYDELREWQRAVAEAAEPEAGLPISQTCPRRVEVGREGETGADQWRLWHNAYGDLARRCTWCGSMHPDDFMAAIADGREIGPTDKNYKAYVGSNHDKFYFQHLSASQRHEFIRLVNDGTMNIGYPGHFYVWPFFCGVKPR